MRHTKFKFYFAWDYQKEEKWLNEMSDIGLQLVDVGMCRYVFEDNNKDRYIYRLELLDNVLSNSKSISYIRFLEETGVEHVGSVLRWAYFRKKAGDGEFELYSDIDSKIKHCKRILFLFFCVTPINVINLINMTNNYINSGYTSYVYISVFLGILVGLLGTGIFKVYRQIWKLKKDKYIME